MCSRISQGEQDERLFRYRAEVVPWLWLLTQSADCKVFQDKTIPEIIEEIFKEWQGKFPELVKYENKLSGSYKKLDYCIQYRETDSNFISRLAEEEGIFFFFKHEEGKHTLVLGDDASAYPECPNLPKARYLPESGMGEWEDGIVTWDHERLLVPGKYAMTDYHFMMSNKSFRPTANAKVKVGNNSNLEVFDVGEYAHRINKPDDPRLQDMESLGEQTAKWRMEQEEAGHLKIRGESTCRAFTTGAAFSLLGAGESQKKVPGTQGSYVLTSVSHAIRQFPPYLTGQGVGQPYVNTFTCVPKESPYRPVRSTPRPVVQGLQTAVVTGLKGEEIDCDKYGRVKVQFHWDRLGEKDEKSSCWVRVGTAWAGKQWGMIHIPRIGQEVIVAFLEGDPDQPIIVGSVFNYDNMPPFKLPDNKTQSGIKTRSSPGGGEEHFNEICFEDKKGKELLYVRAEKDLTKAVENDETIWVGNDRFAEVDNNEELTVDKGNRTITLKQGNDKHQMKMGNREVILDMGNDTLTIKMGNQTTKLDLGKSETEAMQSIELKVGQSSIKVDQTGVTIKGMMITVEGTMQTQVKGMMTDLNGSAMLKVGGGLTMIG
jgi:type VI secretion system secreted protein VgrG